MRLFVSDSKDSIILFIHNYLDEKITNNEVKFIINGREVKGTVEKSILDDDKFEWIEFYINEEVLRIPFNNSSIVRLDKGLFFFETDSHTALIYV